MPAAGRRRAGRRPGPGPLAVEPLEGRRLLAGWPMRLGGTSSDLPGSVTTLADGSTILTGSFADSLSFGGTTLTSSGELDIFIAKVNPDGSHAWAVRVGGAGLDIGFGVATLSDGKSIAVTGFFEKTVKFGSTTLTTPIADQSCMFVAKINANGSFVWATRSGGVGQVISREDLVLENETFLRIAALPDNAIAVAGTFLERVTLGGTMVESSGAEDVFVAKLKPDGQFAWATRLGGAEADYAGGIAGLADGGVVVAGGFRKTASFGGTSLTSAGDDDMFIARMNSNGAVSWVKRAGGVESDRVDAIATTADGSLYVTGTFQKTVAFGGTTLTRAESAGAFIARLTAAGQFVWAKSPGGDTFAAGNRIVVCPDGSVVVAGVFFSGITFGGTKLTSKGDSDVFIAKLKADGQFVWLRGLGGFVSGDYWFWYMYPESASGVTALADGTVVVTGRFADTCTFGGTTLLGNGDFDIFVAKMTPAGSFDLPPAAPTGAKGGADKGAVNLSWTAPPPTGGPPVNDYIVQYRPANQRVVSWTTMPSIFKSTATGVKVTGLVNGTPYLFRVAAVNAGGVGPYSTASAAVTPRTVPGVPTGLSAQAGNGQATLSWQPPASTGGVPIIGYVVQFSSDLVNWTTVPGPFAGTSATVPGLVNGLAYTIRVAAVNAAGTGGFFSTDPLSVFPKGAPALPQGFAVKKGNGQATLSWTAPASNGGSPLTGYRIMYAKKVGAGWGPWVTVNRAAALPTMFAVGGLANGSTYRFKMAAVNALGVGPETTPGVLVTPGK